MQFVLNGVARRLDPDGVLDGVRDVIPERIQTHGVRIDGVVYPVKQAFELASGVSRPDFTSHTALRHLRALGFEIVGPVGSSEGRPAAAGPALAPVPAHEWPWEGSVQAVFVALLEKHGWTITSAADTATKARGVDVLASKADRRLGAEVKGWPSVGYADPRRAAETKRTAPSNQAGHWFSDALLKAMMLLDSHPAHESLIVLPDHDRYRDLARRTRTGRRAANVQVMLLAQDGDHAGDGWTP